MKGITLAALIVGIAGCANISPTPNSNQIFTVYEASAIQNCKALGQVQSDYGMRANQNAKEARLVDGKNQAADLGANWLYVTKNGRGRLTGIAYSCN